MIPARWIQSWREPHSHANGSITTGLNRSQFVLLHRCTAIQGVRIFWHSWLISTGEHIRLTFRNEEPSEPTTQCTFSVGEIQCLIYSPNEPFNFNRCSSCPVRRQIFSILIGDASGLSLTSSSLSFFTKPNRSGEDLTYQLALWYLSACNLTSLDHVFNHSEYHTPSTAMQKN